MKRSIIDTVTISLGNDVYIGFHEDGQKEVRLHRINITPVQLKAIEKYVRKTS
ncbi:MAG TPA: hypothetical protein VEP90_15035 [Methylomirabilota bacterium]|nr:hypothetical protein [Methylomirabilota bacterium]